MRLYFIRHAQSTNNALADSGESERGRSSDAPLTELGHRQAAALADYLASGPSGPEPPGPDSKDLLGFGITHLYCSLMERAVSTGTYIARALGLPLNGWVDIHESGGVFIVDEEGAIRGLPGRNRAELVRDHPDLVVPAEVGDEGWWNRPMESMDERPHRAARVLEELRRKHGEGDRVAIVSHGGFFNWLTADILAVERIRAMWLHTNNASISRFDFTAEMTVVQYMNRTDHLAPELIT